MVAIQEARPGEVNLPVEDNHPAEANHRVDRNHPAEASQAEGCLHPEAEAAARVQAAAEADHPHAAEVVINKFLTP